MLNETQAIKAIVEANAEDIYKDSAQPSLRVVGKSLAQCVSLFATPIGRTAEILEKNIHKYLNKLEGVPEADLVQPNTRILVPVLEKLRYTEEDKVVDYYAEILATASKKESSEKVLVSFIEILNRLSSDEILVLEYIKSKQNTVSLDGMKEAGRVKFKIEPNQKTILLAPKLPIIDINLHTKGEPGYRTIDKNFNNLIEIVKLSHPDNIKSYIDNLVSLGLLEKPYGINFAMGHIYKPLEEHPAVLAHKKTLDIETKELKFDRARLDMTDLCIKLLSLCSK